MPPHSLFSVVPGWPSRPANAIVWASACWCCCIWRRSPFCFAPRTTSSPGWPSLLTWGLLNFVWLLVAAPAGRGGVAVAHHGRGADPAVAVQAGHPDHERQFRRRHADRRRHRFLPSHYLPGTGGEGRGRSRHRRCRCWCCSGGSTRFACGCARRRSAPSFVWSRLTGLSFAVPMDREKAFEFDRLRVAVRALRRAARSTMSPRAASWSRTAPFAIVCRPPRRQPASRASGCRTSSSCSTS